MSLKLRRVLIRTPLCLFIIFLFGFSSLLYALPQDGKVQSGQASISQKSSTRLNIHQNTEKSIIDWRSFDIGSKEHVDFRFRFQLLRQGALPKHIEHPIREPQRQLSEAISQLNIRRDLRKAAPDRG